MKFYYKGQLIRTSKTHAYNWAILTERPDGTYACHGCRVNRSDADSEASHLSRCGVDHIIIAPHLPIQEFIHLTFLNELWKRFLFFRPLDAIYGIRLNIMSCQSKPVEGFQSTEPTFDRCS